ncbi:MAG: hypothetical protein ACI4ED_08565 [Suilimivivens sp.]
MNMAVTESDKKLLSLLAAFVLVILFIFFVFIPLSGKNSKLEKEIEEAKQQEMSMDMSAALAGDMAATEQTVREQMAQVLQRFYPTLQSQQAENMVTILMLNHRLQIQNLSITMPEKASNLKWYQYSVNANPMVPDEALNENSETTETGSGFGVYTARVTCTAEGDGDDLMALVDDISINYPAISILSAEWSTLEVPVENNVSETEDTDENKSEAEAEPVPATVKRGSLTITLEIYMCEQ